MSLTLLRILFAVCIGGATAIAASPVSAEGVTRHQSAAAWSFPRSTTVTAALAGAKEVPGPGDEDGRGLFASVLKRHGLCYTLLARGIEPARAAHIHRAPPGVAGDITVTLTPPASGFSRHCISAVPDDQDTAGTLGRSELAAIRKNPADFYVNVHNAPFPAGAIRGQLSGDRVAERVGPSPRSREGKA